MMMRQSADHVVPDHGRRDVRWLPRLKSFRARLMVLLVLAVSVPALLTCLILGIQLDRQARTLFANTLSASLETFSLILSDNERNLNEGLARAATDNTLQITLELEIRAQLAKYIETQRQVLHIGFLGVYDRNLTIIAFSGDSGVWNGQWKLVDSGKYGDDCVATLQVEQQLVKCNGTMYLVAVAKIERPADSNLGDGSARARTTGLLGYLVGGTPLAAPALISSLQERQVEHPLIWVGEEIVYANIPTKDLPPPRATYGAVTEFDIDHTAYLGTVRSKSVGTQRMTYSVFAPLAPLRTALLRSVFTVAGIGVLLVAITLIAGSFITNRLLRPIRQLRQGAARLGAGDLTQRIAIHTGDELEALANQFNDMAGKLEESYAGLEQKVAQRTQELAASLHDLRTAQDRLVQTEKLASLGQLTAGIAHEIKNPLNFINNFAALSGELLDELDELLRSAPLDGKVKDSVRELSATLKGNLEKVVQHGMRADSIVKNMLLHSREGSGEHRPMDINTILEESLNLAYHGARAEKQDFNVTLQRDLDSSAGAVDLYPQEITRAFLNLISNGFYATTKRKAESGDPSYEPLLSATTRNFGDRVEIRIRDNGTGIPPEVKEKMFNPFFTTKPAGEGTGLGLSMSHDIIVKQHGGTIDVETKRGEFTEFRIVLPRMNRFQEKAKAASA
jgi:signal transduction histidine kinase